MEVKGFEIPRGFKLMNRVPLDAWSGPYSGNTIEEAIDIALSSIPIEIRYKSMQVRILTESYGSIIYWFKNGINNYDFEPMNNGTSSEGGVGYTVLNELIELESSRRISGDTVLQSSIDTERDLRISGDTVLQSNINNERDLRISGYTEALDKFINHTGNTSIHLIEADFNLLRNIQSGVTYNEINQLKDINGNIQGQLNTKSNNDHVHSALYNPSGQTQSLFVDTVGNIHVNGSIFQTGTSYETHSENIHINNDYIYLRSNAIAALGINQYTGLEAVKYDGTSNGRLVFDNTGTARVGDIGNEQPLATRNESNTMTNNGLLYWDSDSSRIKTASLTLDNFDTVYYTKSTANQTFVKLSGGTMTGGLNIQSGGIYITGVTTGDTIMCTSDGTTTLKGINTGDQDLSNLATYVYVNSTFSNVNHEHDSRYVNITGDTISGALLINNEIDDVVFAISGSTGQLLKAIDMQSGSLLQVNNESAIPILQVDSSGYIAEHSNNMVNIYASTVLFEFDKFEGKAAFVNYYVFNPATKAFKAGTLITAWDSINDNITFVNNKTSDIPGGSTEGISIESVIVDSHVQIKAIITDGRWEVDLSVKLI